MIGEIRRHVRLHDALIALSENGQVQQVAIPEDTKPQYYQKYANTLASRWGLKISTRVLDGWMLIGNRRVRPEVHE